MTGGSRDFDSHGAHAETGDDMRMADGSSGVLTEERAHPGNAVATDDVIGVDHLRESGDGGDVSADDDGGTGRELADHAAHFAHLADVHDDGRNADDIVMVFY